jgi:DnaJ-domain-containing protein 1
MDKERLFVISQILVVASLGLAFLWWNRERDQTSGFKPRDPMRPEPTPKKLGSHTVDPLAEAKIKNTAPLRLSGIVIQGDPHEILGVHPQADQKTILAAYKEKMKQYHPDRIAPIDTQAWKDAQEIAQAITRARDELLKRRT